MLFLCELFRCDADLSKDAPVVVALDNRGLMRRISVGFACALTLLISGVVTQAASPGGSTNGCGPYVNGRTNGDTTYPPPCPANNLVDFAGNGFAFTSTKDANGNNQITENGNSYAYGQRAVLQNANSGSAIPTYGDKRFFYYMNYFGNLLWLCDCSYADNGMQVAGPGLLFATQFANITNGRLYTSLAHLTESLAPDQHAVIHAPPVGVPIYKQAALLAAAGVTLTIDRGVYLADTNCETTAIVCMDARGQTLTLNGTLGYTGENEIVDITANRGSNGTINGHGTIDCVNSGSQGILAGWHTGTTKVEGITLKNCGGADGPAHGIYISNGGCGACSAPDPTLSDAITDVTFIDGVGGGFGIKLDDACEGGSATPSPCHDTHIKVYCSGAATCQLTSPMDNQCGGRHLVDYSLLEALADGVVNGNEFQWTFVKTAWDHTGSPAGCTHTEETNNSFTFAHTVFIADGVQAASGFPGYACAPGLRQCATIICAGNFPAGAMSCNANAPGYGHACVHDSQIIQNWTGPFGLGPGPGVYTDAACTTSSPISDSNTHYSSRAAACGVASNWPIDGKDCAYPYIPQFMAESESHDQLVAAAHAAGECGEGTADNPIRRCNDADLRQATRLGTVGLALAR